ncbi:MAG: hypothetical protein NVS4B3_11180 [Gemmatimonadaceae bacterium]
MRGYLGDRVRTVNGLYAHKDSTSLRLHVLSTTLDNGVDRAWHGEDVTIPDGLIARIELAQISKERTVGAVAIAAVLGAIYFANFRGGAGGGGTGGGGGPPGR